MIGLDTLYCMYGKEEQGNGEFYAKYKPGKNVGLSTKR